MKHGETAGTCGNEKMKGAWIVRVCTRDVCPSDFGDMTHETKTHFQIIITSHRPTTEHPPATNLIESADLIRDPTWNIMEFFWLKRHANPCHPFNFYRLQEQIRSSDYARTELVYFFLCLTIFSNTWRPKGHPWARAGEGICSLDFGG